MTAKVNWMCVVPPQRRPPQGHAASKRATARLRRLRPCPSRRPAAVEMGLQEEDGDPHAEARTDRHKGAPLHRDALTQIDDVERDCS
jgi:hypothetical protein